MRALLDEKMPKALVGLLAPEIDARTVQPHGLSGLKNGDLLLAASKSFNILITTDRGIPHQQNLSRYQLWIVLLEARSNRIEDLAPLVPKLKAMLDSIPHGVVTRVAG